MASGKQKTTLYWWYKEHGICVRCGWQPARPGRTQCKACAAKSAGRENARLQALAPEQVEEKHKKDREQREFYRQRGFCPQCGREKSAPGGVMCTTCNAKRRDWYAQRKAQGVCVKCGKATPLPGHTRCARCKAAQDEQRRRRTAKQLPEDGRR